MIWSIRAGLYALLVVGAGLLLSGGTSEAAAAPKHFSKPEIDRIRSYWAGPGRYTVTLPDAAATEGPFQVRQTAAGSEWLLTYFRARSDQKVIPNRDPQAATEREAAWDVWIDRRMAMDYFLAEQAALRNNMLRLGKPIPAPKAPPVDAGPIPADLKALAGTPPPFAQVALPRRHIIRFEDGITIDYVDYPQMRQKFAYFRWPQGVMDSGQRMREVPQEVLDRLFAAAGIDGKMLRVLTAVSLLEGGFDSVNTYDTGFVSVGFIQFASLRAGAGSLGRVLLNLKRNQPAAFELDFRRYGIDVTADGQLVALDLATSEEKVGPDANLAIIRDKRLIAAFQRAGQLEPFRVAQLRVAVEEYYPDDVLRLTAGGKTHEVRVLDIFRSEAGIATLMDRKVNTGTLNPLPEVLTEFMSQNGITDPARLADYEFHLVRRMEYRKDYLADATLSQPREVPITTNRSGGRP